MRFDFDESGMQVIEGAVTDLTEELARRVAHAARSNCPVNTGTLRRTIAAYGNRVYCGGPDAPYWANVEFGTAPHVIRPSAKKALSWPGAEHPVASVNHPGTPEFAFMRRALYNPRTLA